MKRLLIVFGIIAITAGVEQVVLSGGAAKAAVMIHRPCLSR